MVYTITHPPINNSSLLESYYEFKMDMLQYEQNMFEMFADIEYNSILNESYEIIHEGRIMDIVQKIVEMIKKFGRFVREQWKKFKMFIVQKISKWKAKTTEAESNIKGGTNTNVKTQDKEELENKEEEKVYRKSINGHSISSASRGKELKVVEIDCIRLNINGISNAMNKFDVLSDLCDMYSECVNDIQESFMKSSGNSVSVNNIYGRVLMRIQKKTGGENNINAYLNKRLEADDDTSLKETIKNSFIQTISIKSNDKSKIGGLKSDMNRASTQWVKEFDKVYDAISKMCNQLEKDADSLLKIKNINYNNSDGENITEGISKSLSFIPKMTSAIISKSTEVYNASIEGLIYGIDQTNISYLKLLKANPVIINW